MVCVCAGNYRKVGLIVQRAILIVTLACVPFAAIWLSSEQIFLLCRLPPKLSALAGRYCMYAGPPTLGKCSTAPPLSRVRYCAWPVPARCSYHRVRSSLLRARA